MNRHPIIAIIDDELTIREVVRRYLEVEGWNVIEADTGQNALALLRERRVDLIVLDIMLPGIDGFTITRSLRHSPQYTALHGDVPIIMLTSRRDEADRIAGFELGIDDYVIKPFSPRELVARVKAVLRRSSATANTPTEQPITLGALYIDPLRRVVTVQDQPVTLTAKEFDLLWHFVRNPRQVFTREQLITQVWGYEYYGDESTVTVHIRRLREKIEVDAAQPTLIQTVWGIGYKFEP